MRALPVVLLLVLAHPAFAQTAAPPAAEQPAAEPPAAEPPATEPPATVETPDAAPPKPVVIAPPSTIAPAGGEPMKEEPGPPPKKYGYRWQVVSADAAVVAMSVLINQISKDGGERPGALATFTIASYFFAAPMVHGIHRQGKRALGSFALRAGLPLLLGLLGEQIDSTPECDTCEDTLRSDGKVIGLTAGVLISMALDTVLLARPIYKRSERTPRAAWAPVLSGVRGGATAGVFGTF